MSSEDLFLDAAVAIGRNIAADAAWYDGRCSWVGAATWRPASMTAEYHALGPSLYGGTAGVGLFLAHIADMTGDGSFRRTAVGALGHATSRAGQSPPVRRDGFHAGSLGVAWAAARVGRLLREEALYARAVELSGQQDTPSGPDGCSDLISGIAGSAFGLLALADELEDQALVEKARLMGEVLIGRATVSAHGWSWARPGVRYPAHLCGVSHGAAGIGWALLELFAATGDERFRAGALGAFAYERSWLDRATGRWPDLRIGGQSPGAVAPIDSGIEGTWCHGEAGIALTRLRALAVLGPGLHETDAEIAITTTHRHLADALPYAFDDLSLCHGLGGAADLMVSAASLGDQYSVADVLTQLGTVVLERYADVASSWPCGGAGETTPALYPGLSGIGWLLLRLHDWAIPSPFVTSGHLTTAVRCT
jgi:lantibiotic biosynthesis protein